MHGVLQLVSDEGGRQCTSLSLDVDSLNDRSWPACYVEGWFRDGALCLFEEGARRLIAIEDNPQIIVVLAGVVRRKRLLEGIRAAINRKSFHADLKALTRGNSEAFTEAMRIVAPNSARQSFTQQQPQQQSSSKEIAVLIRLTRVQVARSVPSLSRPRRRCTMWSLALPSWLLRVSR